MQQTTKEILKFANQIRGLKKDTPNYEETVIKLTNSLLSQELENIFLEMEKVIDERSKLREAVVNDEYDNSFNSGYDVSKGEIKRSLNKLREEYLK